MKSIQQCDNLANKKVLVRVDFNVPLGDESGAEAWRIKAAVPTIQFLLSQSAKVILMTHLGRPEGVKMEEFSVKKVSTQVNEVLGREVKVLSDCVGEEVEKAVEVMQGGEVVLLENLRFYKEEEENDTQFAQQLARLADVYVNDAFSVSHRAHASVEAVTRFLPSYAGMSLEKEVEYLSKVLSGNIHPLTVIIGGLKAETKLPVIGFLLNQVDDVLVGGVVANFLLRAQGVDIGQSKLDNLSAAEVAKIDLQNSKINTPVDVATDNPTKTQVVLSEGGVEGYRILDIGEKTIEKYQEIIKQSRMVIWSGTMGVFEDERYAEGTRAIAQAMVESSAQTIVGGGDTIFALEKMGYIDKMTHISTGGGAMLEFLSGKLLPGVVALQVNS